MMMQSCYILSWILLLLFTLDKAASELFESDRLEEYHRRNYTWPLNNFSPDTAGWAKLMNARFEQVADIETVEDRFKAYIQTIHSAFLVPNFTEHGFGLARCPEDLLVDLRKGIKEGFENGPRLEDVVDFIDGPKPWFVDRPDLTSRVLSELQGYAEEWSGVDLAPFTAYGFRLYRNDSQLLMHVDQMQTRVVSFILHIDSSDDAEPWPLFIEDFHGRTHEVTLTPGDILFYESAKCVHGRPKRFRGTWYSSLFVHYYPRNGWYEKNHDLEEQYAIPPHWNKAPTADSKSGRERLQMVGGYMKEPECPNDWCRSMESVKWSGPGEDGFWIAPTFEKYRFQPDFGRTSEL